MNTLTDVVAARAADEIQALRQEADSQRAANDKERAEAVQKLADTQAALVTARAEAHRLAVDEPNDAARSHVDRVDRERHPRRADFRRAERFRDAIAQPARVDHERGTDALEQVTDVVVPGEQHVLEQQRGETARAPERVARRMTNQNPDRAAVPSQ